VNPVYMVYWSEAIDDAIVPRAASFAAGAMAEALASRCVSLPFARKTRTRWVGRASPIRPPTMRGRSAVDKRFGMPIAHAHDARDGRIARKPA